MTRYSYLIVRTGTFKYFQQDRKNWKIPQKNFENLFESIIFKKTWIEFQKTVTDYPSVRIYSIPE